MHSVPENVGAEEEKYKSNMEYFKYKSCSSYFE